MSSKESEPIQITKQSNETGFDFPFSPSEPGKFDFYRVHLSNQNQTNDSMFSDHFDTPTTPVDLSKRWTPFANMKHLSDQPKAFNSASALFSPATKASTDVDVPSKALNKPIQTVASFSSLTDAVKSAMQRGQFDSPANKLRRPASGTTLSSKELNHLSPQSM